METKRTQCRFDWPIICLRGLILDLKGPIPDLKGPIPGLRGSTPNLRGRIAGLRGPIQGLKRPIRDAFHAWYGLSHAWELCGPYLNKVGKAISFHFWKGSFRHGFLPGLTSPPSSESWLYKWIRGPMIGEKVRIVGEGPEWSQGPLPDVLSPYFSVWDAPKVVFIRIYLIFYLLFIKIYQNFI